ncbi:hypothetical protein ONZ51_g12578 [Trametes cubensis]|uniref:Uncharacterized protein n=1 Tax=Trametes cubensis TaxID=1111947 RepID=A0AAD7TFI1_9APHY|nr:hypothetical protein ONZ51_g12578 [Trametes cubensis]
MSEKSHKRKRSIQDTPVDLTKMQLAKRHLVALQEELAGVQETEETMEEAMRLVDALASILGTAKKLKLSFSSLQDSDLVNMGVKRNVLLFKDPLPGAQTSKLVIDEEHVDSLCTHIGHIHRHVSMRYEPGARMILDAIVLTVARICVETGAKLPVAILPGVRVSAGDGTLIENRATGYQVWLTGNTDYGMCTYEIDALRLMRFAKSRIMMVEAKRPDGDKSFEDHLPEATGQAIALAEVTNKPVRYCLSNGKNWLFSVFAKDAKGNRVAYEGIPIDISIDNIDDAKDLFKSDVRRVVELLHHWLVSPVDPLNDPLYTLSSTDPSM